MTHVSAADPLRGPDEPVRDSQLRLFREKQRTEISWWGVFVVFAAFVFVVAFTVFQWATFHQFNLYGFDTGIFAQGTWLLSHFQAPFVTIRGLNLFGDHASFILILVAPLYRLWPSPQLLVLLQSVAMAVPAVVIYLLGARWVSKYAGAAIALVYLLSPAAQWAAAWEFHPEVLAAAFLSVAVWAADTRHRKTMIVFLCLAASCKEDVSLVILGFGVLLATLGRRREGLIVAGAAIAYFVLVTQVVMRLINHGNGNIYFQRNYGIDGSGPLAILVGLPHIAGHMFGTAFSNAGIIYLSLIFAPLLFLSFLGGRWLLPVLAPLSLNLASNVEYQHQIGYHYLATSAPFVAIAALVGLQRLQKVQLHKWSTPAVLVLMLVVAGGLSWTHGPRDAMRGPLLDTHMADARTDVLKMIPSGAAVVADYSMDTHLSGRTTVYEFPNPYHPANWGATDTPVSQDKIDAIEYVVVDRGILGDEDKARINQMQADPAWETKYDNGSLVLLHKLPPGSVNVARAMTTTPVG